VNAGGFVFWLSFRWEERRLLKRRAVCALALIEIRCRHHHSGFCALFHASVANILGGKQNFYEVS
jgi:hypothetical protein